MTHDDLTDWARRTSTDPREREMADRLDQYRILLERALPMLHAHWCDQERLRDEIQEALK